MADDDKKGGGGSIFAPKNGLEAWLHEVRADIRRELVEIPTYGRPVTEGVPRSMVEKAKPETPEEPQKENDPSAGIEAPKVEAPEISDPLDERVGARFERMKDDLQQSAHGMDTSRDRGIDR